MAKNYGCIEYRDEHALSAIEKQAGIALDHEAVWEEAYDNATSKGIDSAEVRIAGLDYIEIYNIGTGDSAYDEISQRIQRELLAVGDRELEDYAPKLLQVVYREGASITDVADTLSRIKRLANAMELVIDNWDDHEPEPTIPSKYTKHWELTLLLDTSVKPLETDWVQQLIKKSIIPPKIDYDKKLAYTITERDGANFVYLELPQEAIRKAGDFENEVLRPHEADGLLRYLLIHYTPKTAIRKQDLR